MTKPIEIPPKGDDALAMTPVLPTDKAALDYLADRVIAHLQSGAWVAPKYQPALDANDLRYDPISRKFIKT